MNQRASYLLQILESIGTPLMSAITDATKVGAPENDPQKDAHAMAALLGKTVEASIELGNIMDINPAEAQDDTLRVALAGLAGPLVAGLYAKRGRIPDAPDLKKITAALQAVLTFSDNFTPTPETVERLKSLKASGGIVDSYQTQVQYMQAFIPVVEAVAAFPFGQAETKLIMDVSDRLVKKSIELREALLPGVDDDAQQKVVELGLLRALACLYSSCHKAETARVLGLDDAARGAGLTIEPVWKAFDLRTAMLEALAAKMVPGGQGQNSVDNARAPIASENPPAAMPPQTPPPAVSPEAPPTSAAAGANPMAMFAKPKNDEAAPQTPSPAAEPSVTPPPDTPKDVPQDPPPPAQSGSPMSFFRKKDDEE